MKKTFLITFIFLSIFLFVSCGSSTKHESKEENSTLEISNESTNEIIESSFESISSIGDESTSSKEEKTTNGESTNKIESSIKESISEVESSNNDSVSNLVESSIENINTYNINISYNVYDNSTNILETSETGTEFGTFTQSMKVNEASNLDLSAELKEGYTFVGWYNGSTRLSTSTKYKLENITTDYEIEARLRYKSYNVTVKSLNTDAGLVKINNTEYDNQIIFNAKYKTEISVSTNALKEVIDGFYLKDELLSSDTEFTFKVPNSDCEILLAFNIFSIKYDLNGGDNNNANNPISYTAEDNDITLLDPTYEGYTFLGWYDDKDNKVETIDTSSKKNYNLKAKWAENENTPYSVQILCFDTDAYEYVLDEEKSYTAYGKTDDYTNVEYNDILGYKKNDSSISQQKIDRFGNTVIQLRYYPLYKSITLVFDEFYAGSVDGKQSNYFGKEVSFDIKMSNEYNYLGVYDSLDDGANQIIDDSTLSFDMSIDAVDKIYYIKTEKCAYRVTTYQKFVGEEGYVITFDANGGVFTQYDDAPSITQDSLNLIYEIPTRTDALFRGWYASKYSSTTTSLCKYFTEDTTLYARWLEESDWHYYGINSENITLGYVNGKYEVCENEYPSNSSYYGGALVFSPLVYGKVKFFVSGCGISSIKLYQYKNSNFTEVSCNSDGNYLESSSNLSRGGIYYILVDGTHGEKYGIDIRGDYPEDYRDFISDTYDSETLTMQKYGYINLLKDALYNDSDNVSLQASTNVNTSESIGYDLLFTGWYNKKTDELISTDFEAGYAITEDTELEARWERIELVITNNFGYSKMVTYSVNNSFEPYKYGSEFVISFELEDGLQFDEFEYKGELYDSIQENAIVFDLTIESSVIEIKLNLSYKTYSLTITGDVSNVNVNGSYLSDYQYNSLININLDNESGHTIKWYLNDAYYAYGDSVEVVIYNETVVRYELANIDLFNDNKNAYFGTYPQTLVADDTLLTNLNSKITVPSSYKSKSSTLPTGWNDYGYWSYSADYSGYRTSVYTDVSYKNEKYRAIYIFNYRQDNYIGGSSKTTYQSNSGYSLNTIYWFKFESIKWDVLSIDDYGNISLVTSNSIDSTQYCKNKNDDPYSHNGYTAYSTSYEASDLRIWLNNNFYNLAFDTEEKNSLNKNTISGEHETYSPNSTEDYVYILSRVEVDNYSMNGENDGTDYAVAQGFDTTAKASWTRTPYSNNLMYKTSGYMPYVYSVYVGVRPVINITI